VSVRRADGPTDTVPVARFSNGRPPRLNAGDEVVVTGRVRRRFFRAGGVTASRTEVVADTLTRASQTRRAAAAVERALRPLLEAD
jgi:single-strand DNA-binding protein